MSLVITSMKMPMDLSMYPKIGKMTSGKAGGLLLQLQPVRCMVNLLYHIRQLRPAEIPVTAAIISSLKGQVYDFSPNYICPGTECNVTDVDMLAVCSTCKSEAITVDSFNGCSATVGRADYFDYYLWSEQGHMPAPEVEQKIEPLLQELNYQPLITGLDRQELKEYLIEKIQSNYSAAREFNVVINCQKDYMHIPPLVLRIYAGSQFVLLSHQEGSYQKAELHAAENISNIIHIQGHGFTSCRYSGNGEIQRNEHPRIAQATCFTSKTQLYLYRDLERIGEVNGTAISCNLDFCAHHYDLIVIRNSQKTYHGLRKERLMPLHTGLEHEISSRYASLRGQGEFVIFEHDLEELTSMFLRNANITIPQLITMGTKNFRNVTLLFERFAERMSFAIQSYANPNGNNMTMNVFDEEQVVRIQWAFMTVPFVTVISGCIFIALTIYISRTKCYVLKTSILAAIFHGADALDEEQEEENDARPAAKINVSDQRLMKRAEKISMVFEQLDGERRRLRKV